jgi:hypothetical protein
MCRPYPLLCFQSLTRATVMTTNDMSRGLTTELQRTQREEDRHWLLHKVTYSRDSRPCVSVRRTLN